MTAARPRSRSKQLLASVSAQVVDGIADGRKLSPGAVRAAIDRGPLLRRRGAPGEARRPASATATRRLPRPASAPGREAKLVGLSTYLDGAERPNRERRDGSR